MPVLAPGDADYAFEFHHCDYKCSCAASWKNPDVLGVLECLSSEHDAVVVRGVAAGLGSCFGGSTDTVLQNDT